MVNKNIGKYTEKLIENRINAEIDRQMKLKVDAVTEYITKQLFDALRSNGVGKDRANKIVQDMVKSMIG